MNDESLYRSVVTTFVQTGVLQYQHDKYSDWCFVEALSPLRHLHSPWFRISMRPIDWAKMSTNGQSWNNYMEATAISASSICASRSCTASMAFAVSRGATVAGAGADLPVATISSCCNRSSSGQCWMSHHVLGIPTCALNITEVSLFSCLNLYRIALSSTEFRVNSCVLLIQNKILANIQNNFWCSRIFTFIKTTRRLSEASEQLRDLKVSFSCYWNRTLYLPLFPSKEDSLIKPFTSSSTAFWALSVACHQSSKQCYAHSPRGSGVTGRGALQHTSVRASWLKAPLRRSGHRAAIQAR